MPITAKSLDDYSLSRGRGVEHYEAVRQRIRDDYEHALIDCTCYDALLAQLLGDQLANGCLEEAVSSRTRTVPEEG